MFRPFARPVSALGRQRCRPEQVTTPPCCVTVTPSQRRGLFKTTSGKTSNSLRILFCGSDHFSVESLRALHEEHLHSRSLVDRIDVVVQPPKMIGRGNKQQSVVPCKDAAQELGLPIHHLKTFTGWEMPKDINLIIAVSFGLFVPPRLLRAAKYGGLNVHPSFLPDLRGPAPIHHAILRGDEYMGVSLQTMHEKTFDHGVVLSQTPAPGLQIRANRNLARTTQKLAIEGAELLVQGLRAGLHIEPYEDAGWKAAELEKTSAPLKHAPKITKSDLQVDWDSWTPEMWRRHLQVGQAVWTLGRSKEKKGPSLPRMLFHDCEPVEEDAVRGQKGTVEFVSEGKDGEHKAVRKSVYVCQRSGEVFVELTTGSWIRLRRMTLEGRPEKPAMTVVRLFLVDDGAEAKKTEGKSE